MKRIDLLAAMYAQITGDAEADALKAIKRTDAGRAIADESEIYLYNQPTHNLTEIAWGLRDENLRKQFTESAIDAAYQAVKDRETAEKSRQAEKDRAFADITPDRFAEDEDDEPEDEDDAENE